MAVGVKSNFNCGQITPGLIDSYESSKISTLRAIRRGKVARAVQIALIAAFAAFFFLDLILYSAKALGWVAAVISDASSWMKDSLEPIRLFFKIPPAEEILPTAWETYILWPPEYAWVVILAGCLLPTIAFWGIPRWCHHSLSLLSSPAVRLKIKPRTRRSEIPWRVRQWGNIAGGIAILLAGFVVFRLAFSSSPLLSLAFAVPVAIAIIIHRKVPWVYLGMVLVTIGMFMGTYWILITGNFTFPIIILTWAAGGAIYVIFYSPRRGGYKSRPIHVSPARVQKWKRCILGLSLFLGIFLIGLNLFPMSPTGALLAGTAGIVPHRSGKARKKLIYFGRLVYLLTIVPLVGSLESLCGRAIFIGTNIKHFCQRVTRRVQDRVNVIIKKIRVELARHKWGKRLLVVCRGLRAFGQAFKGSPRLAPRPLSSLVLGVCEAISLDILVLINARAFFPAAVGGGLLGSVLALVIGLTCMVFTLILCPLTFLIITCILVLLARVGNRVAHRHWVAWLASRATHKARVREWRRRMWHWHLLKWRHWREKRKRVASYGLQTPDNYAADPHARDDHVYESEGHPPVRPLVSHAHTPFKIAALGVFILALFGLQIIVTSPGMDQFLPFGELPHAALPLGTPPYLSWSGAEINANPCKQFYSSNESYILAMAKTGAGGTTTTELFLGDGEHEPVSYKGTTGFMWWPFTFVAESWPDWINPAEYGLPAPIIDQHCWPYGDPSLADPDSIAYNITVPEDLRSKFEWITVQPAVLAYGNMTWDSSLPDPQPLVISFAGAGPIAVLVDAVAEYDEINLLVDGVSVKPEASSEAPVPFSCREVAALVEQSPYLCYRRFVDPGVHSVSFDGALSVNYYVLTELDYDFDGLSDSYEFGQGYLEPFYSDAYATIEYISDPVVLDEMGNDVEWPIPDTVTSPLLSFDQVTYHLIIPEEYWSSHGQAETSMTVFSGMYDNFIVNDDPDLLANVTLQGSMASFGTSRIEADGVAPIELSSRKVAYCEQHYIGDLPAGDNTIEYRVYEDLFESAAIQFYINEWPVPVIDEQEIADSLKDSDLDGLRDSDDPSREASIALPASSILHLVLPYLGRAEDADVKVDLIIKHPATDWGTHGAETLTWHGPDTFNPLTGTEYGEASAPECVIKPALRWIGPATSFNASRMVPVPWKNDAELGTYFGKTIKGVSLVDGVDPGTVRADPIASGEDPYGIYSYIFAEETNSSFLFSVEIPSRHPALILDTPDVLSLHLEPVWVVISTDPITGEQGLLHVYPIEEDLVVQSIQMVEMKDARYTLASPTSWLENLGTFLWAENENLEGASILADRVIAQGDVPFLQKQGYNRTNASTWGIADYVLNARTIVEEHRFSGYASGERPVEWHARAYDDFNVVDKYCGKNKVLRVGIQTYRLTRSLQTDIYGGNLEWSFMVPCDQFGQPVLYDRVEVGVARWGEMIFGVTISNQKFWYGTTEIGPAVPGTWYKVDLVFETDYNSADVYIDGKICLENVQNLFPGYLPNEIVIDMSQAGGPCSVFVDDIVLTASKVSRRVNEVAYYSLVENYRDVAFQANHSILTKSGSGELLTSYPGTYTFDDGVPWVAYPDAWSTDDFEGLNPVLLGHAVETHQDVIRFLDNGAGAAHLTYTLPECYAEGTLEWWLYAEDASEEFAIQFQDGANGAGTSAFTLRVKDDQLQHMNDAGEWADIMQMKDNGWYHLALRWNASELPYGTYTLYVMGMGTNYLARNFTTAVPGIASIIFRTGDRDAGYSYYLDAVSSSADEDHVLGAGYVPLDIIYSGEMEQKRVWSTIFDKYNGTYASDAPELVGMDAIVYKTGIGSSGVVSHLTSIDGYPTSIAMTPATGYEPYSELTVDKLFGTIPSGTLIKLPWFSGEVPEGVYAVETSFLETRLELADPYSGDDGTLPPPVTLSERGLDTCTTAIIYSLSPQISPGSASSPSTASRAGISRAPSTAPILKVRIGIASSSKIPWKKLKNIIDFNNFLHIGIDAIGLKYARDFTLDCVRLNARVTEGMQKWSIPRMNSLIPHLQEYLEDLRARLQGPPWISKGERTKINSLLKRFGYMLEDPPLGCEDAFFMKQYFAGKDGILGYITESWEWGRCVRKWQILDAGGSIPDVGVPNLISQTPKSKSYRVISYLTTDDVLDMMRVARGGFEDLYNVLSLGSRHGQPFVGMIDVVVNPKSSFIQSLNEVWHVHSPGDPTIFTNDDLIRAMRKCAGVEVPGWGTIPVDVVNWDGKNVLAAAPDDAFIICYRQPDPSSLGIWMGGVYTTEMRADLRTLSGSIDSALIITQRPTLITWSSYEDFWVIHGVMAPRKGAGPNILAVSMLEEGRINTGRNSQTFFSLKYPDTFGSQFVTFRPSAKELLQTTGEICFDGVPRLVPYRTVAWVHNVYGTIQFGYMPRDLRKWFHQVTLPAFDYLNPVTGKIEIRALTRWVQSYDIENVMIFSPHRVFGSLQSFQQIHTMESEVEEAFHDIMGLYSELEWGRLPDEKIIPFLNRVVGGQIIPNAPIEFLTEGLEFDVWYRRVCRPFWGKKGVWLPDITSGGGIGMWVGWNRFNIGGKYRDSMLMAGLGSFYGSPPTGRFRVSPDLFVQKHLLPWVEGSLYRRTLLSIDELPPISKRMTLWYKQKKVTSLFNELDIIRSEWGAKPFDEWFFTVQSYFRPSVCVAGIEGVPDWNVIKAEDLRLASARLITERYDNMYNLLKKFRDIFDDVGITDPVSKLKQFPPAYQRYVAERLREAYLDMEAVRPTFGHPSPSFASKSYLLGYDLLKGQYGFTPSSFFKAQTKYGYFRNTNLFDYVSGRVQGIPLGGLADLQTKDISYFTSPGFKKMCIDLGLPVTSVTLGSVDLHDLRSFFTAALAPDSSPALRLNYDTNFARRFNYWRKTGHVMPEHAGSAFWADYDPYTPHGLADVWRDYNWRRVDIAAQAKAIYPDPEMPDWAVKARASFTSTMRARAGITWFEEVFEKPPAHYFEYKELMDACTDQSYAEIENLMRRVNTQFPETAEAYGRLLKAGMQVDWGAVGTRVLGVAAEFLQGMAFDIIFDIPEMFSKVVMRLNQGWDYWDAIGDTVFKHLPEWIIEGVLTAAAGALCTAAGAGALATMAWPMIVAMAVGMIWFFCVDQYEAACHEISSAYTPELLFPEATNRSMTVNGGLEVGDKLVVRTNITNLGWWKETDPTALGWWIYMDSTGADFGFRDAHFVAPSTHLPTPTDYDMLGPWSSGSLRTHRWRADPWTQEWYLYIDGSDPLIYYNWLTLDTATPDPTLYSFVQFKTFYRDNAIPPVDHVVETPLVHTTSRLEGLTICEPTITGFIAASTRNSISPSLGEIEDRVSNATGGYRWGTAATILAEGADVATTEAIISESTLLAWEARRIELDDLDAPVLGVTLANGTFRPFSTEERDDYDLFQCTSFAEYGSFFHAGSQYLDLGFRAAVPSVLNASRDLWYFQGWEAWAEGLLTRPWGYFDTFATPMAIPDGDNWEVWAGAGSQVDVRLITSGVAGKHLVMYDGAHYDGSAGTCGAYMPFAPSSHGAVEFRLRVSDAQKYVCGGLYAYSSEDYRNSRDVPRVAVVEVDDGVIKYAGTTLGVVDSGEDIWVRLVYNCGSGTVDIFLKGHINWGYAADWVLFYPDAPLLSSYIPNRFEVMTGGEDDDYSVFLDDIDMEFTPCREFADAAAFDATNPSGLILIPKYFWNYTRDLLNTAKNYSLEIAELPCQTDFVVTPPWEDLYVLNPRETLAGTYIFALDVSPGDVDKALVINVTAPTGFSCSYDPTGATMGTLSSIDFYIVPDVDTPAGVYTLGVEITLPTGELVFRHAARFRYAHNASVLVNLLPWTGSDLMGTEFTWAEIFNDGNIPAGAVVMLDGNLPSDWVRSHQYMPMYEATFNLGSEGWSMDNGLTFATTGHEFLGRAPITEFTFVNPATPSVNYGSAGYIENMPAYFQVPEYVGTSSGVIKAVVMMEGYKEYDKEFGLANNLWSTGVSAGWTEGIITWNNRPSLAGNPFVCGLIGAVWSVNTRINLLDLTPGEWYYLEPIIQSGYYGPYLQDRAFLSDDFIEPARRPFVYFYRDTTMPASGELCIGGYTAAHCPVDLEVRPGDRIRVGFDLPPLDMIDSFGSQSESVILEAGESFALGLSGSVVMGSREASFTFTDYHHLTSLGIEAKLLGEKVLAIDYIYVERAVSDYRLVAYLAFAGGDPSDYNCSAGFSSGKNDIYVDQPILNAGSILSTFPSMTAVQDPLFFGSSAGAIYETFLEIPAYPYIDLGSASSLIALKTGATYVPGSFIVTNAGAFDASTLTWDSRDLLTGTLAFEALPATDSGTLWFDASGHSGQFIRIAGADGAYVQCAGPTAETMMDRPKVTFISPKASVTMDNLVLTTNTTEVATLTWSANINVLPGDFFHAQFQCLTTGPVSMQFTGLTGDPVVIPLTTGLSSSAEDRRLSYNFAESRNFTQVTLTVPMASGQSFNLSSIEILRPQANGTGFGNASIGGFYNGSMDWSDFATWENLGRWDFSDGLGSTWVVDYGSGSSQIIENMPVEKGVSFRASTPAVNYGQNNMWETGNYDAYRTFFEIPEQPATYSLQSSFVLHIAPTGLIPSAPTRIAIARSSSIEEDDLTYQNQPTLQSALYEKTLDTSAPDWLGWMSFDALTPGTYQLWCPEYEDSLATVTFNSDESLLNAPWLSHSHDKVGTDGALIIQSDVVETINLVSPFSTAVDATTRVRVRFQYRGTGAAQLVAGSENFMLHEAGEASMWGFVERRFQFTSAQDLNQLGLSIQLAAGDRLVVESIIIEKPAAPLEEMLYYPEHRGVVVLDGTAGPATAEYLFGSEVTQGTFETWVASEGNWTVDLLSGAGSISLVLSGGILYLQNGSVRVPYLDYLSTDWVHVALNWTCTADSQESRFSIQINNNTLSSGVSYFLAPPYRTRPVVPWGIFGVRLSVASDSILYIDAPSCSWESDYTLHENFVENYINGTSQSFYFAPGDWAQCIFALPPRASSTPAGQYEVFARVYDGKSGKLIGVYSQQFDTRFYDTTLTATGSVELFYQADLVEGVTTFSYDFTLQNLGNMPQEYILSADALVSGITSSFSLDGEIQGSGPVNILLSPGQSTSITLSLSDVPQGTCNFTMVASSLADGSQYCIPCSYFFNLKPSILSSGDIAFEQGAAATPVSWTLSDPSPVEGAYGVENWYGAYTNATLHDYGSQYWATYTFDGLSADELPPGWVADSYFVAGGGSAPAYRCNGGSLDLGGTWFDADYSDTWVPFADQAAGAVEWYMRVAYGSLEVGLYHDGIPVATVIGRHVDDWPLTMSTNGITVPASTGHIRLSFDAIAQVYSIDVSGWSCSNIPFINTLVPNEFRVHLSDSCTYTYYGQYMGAGSVDAIGFSWDPNYRVGDNLHTCLVASGSFDPAGEVIALNTNNLITDPSKGYEEYKYVLSCSDSVFMSGPSICIARVMEPEPVVIPVRDAITYEYGSSGNTLAWQVLDLSASNPTSELWEIGEELVGHYWGSESFMSVPVGTMPAGWAVSDPASVSVVEGIGDHSQCLRIWDDNYASVSFASQSKGAIEWYAYGTQPGRFYAQFIDAQGSLCRMTVDPRRQQWDMGFWAASPPEWHAETQYMVNYWHRYRLEFDTFAQTYALTIFVPGFVSVDPWSQYRIGEGPSCTMTGSFTRPSTGITGIEFGAYRGIGGQDTEWFVDALGYSWDPFYRLGGLLSYEREMSLCTSGTWTPGSITEVAVDGLAMGSHEFTFVTFDGNGLAASCPATVTVFNVPPVFASEPDTLSFLAGTLAPSLEWVPADISTQAPTYRILVDGEIEVTGIPWVSGETIAWNPSVLLLGEHVVRLELDDGLGGTLQGEVIVRANDQVSFVNVPIDFSYHVGDATFNVGWTVSDMLGLSPTYNLFLRGFEGETGIGESIKTGSWASGPATSIIVNMGEFYLASGLYLASMVVSDGLGTQATDQVVFCVTPEGMSPLDWLESQLVEAGSGMTCGTSSGAVTVDVTFDTAEDTQVAIGIWDAPPQPLGPDFATEGTYFTVDAEREAAVTFPIYVTVTLPGGFPMGMTESDVAAWLRMLTFDEISETWVDPQFDIVDIDMVAGTATFEVLHLSTFALGFANGLPPKIDGPGSLVYEWNAPAPQLVTWRLADLTVGSNPTYTVFLNGASFAQGVWIFGTEVTVDASGWPLGIYDLEMIAFDDLGGVTSHHVPVEVCNMPPVLDQPVDVNYEAGSLGHSITWVPLDISVGEPTYVATVDGTQAASGTWASGAGIPISVDGFIPGTHVVEITVGDGLGGSASDQVIIVVTNMPPVVATQGTITYEAGDPRPVVEWVVTDPSVFAGGYVVYCDDNVVASGQWTPGAPFVVSVSGLAPGTHSYMCVVADGFGGTGAGSVDVIVIPDDDVSPPIIVNIECEPVLDTAQWIPVKVFVSDSESGISQVIIAYEGQSYDAELVGDYYAVNLPNPGVAGTRIAMVTAWDDDRDYPGDALSASKAVPVTFINTLPQVTAYYMNATLAGEYPATYTFSDRDLVPFATGWVAGVQEVYGQPAPGLTSDYCHLLPEYAGHADVLELLKNSSIAQVIAAYFAGYEIPSGSVELWVAVEGDASFLAALNAFTSGISGPWVGVVQGQLIFLSASGQLTMLGSFSPGWHRLCIEFAGAGTSIANLPENHIALTLDDTSLGTFDAGAPLHVTGFAAAASQVGNAPSPAEGSLYLDAVGFSWDSNYITGMNRVPGICLSQAPTPEVTLVAGEGGAALQWLPSDVAFVDPHYEIFLDGTLRTSGSWASGALIAWAISDLEAGDYDVEMVLDDGMGGVVTSHVILHVEASSQAILDEIDGLIQLIEESANSDWRNPAGQRKQAMIDKLDEVRALVLAGDLDGAYDKLLHDIKPKLTGLKVDENGVPWGNGIFDNPWVEEPTLQGTFCGLVDEILAGIREIRPNAGIADDSSCDLTADSSQGDLAAIYYNCILWGACALLLFLGMITYRRRLKSARR